MDSEGLTDALGASYRLLERHGQGATGEVWRAVDRRSGETVAAKLLRSEHTADRDLVGRFIRERSILTGLRHPGIVAVRDLVVEGDRLAIVMDFVDGGSLRDVLRREGPLAPALACRVTAAVLDGLATAHSEGVLHRDLKPDNVLLTQEWQRVEPGDVRLTDFGIARILAEGAGTTTGLLGTPEYMSPELLATGRCDLSSDVYGVGILLYELLAGRTPFAGPGTDYTVAHRHVTSEPPRLPIPDSLWEALSTLLAKDPSARPSAVQAAAALRALLPELADLPALTVQAPPEDFAPARGPATLVRGLVPEDLAPATGAHRADVETDTQPGPESDDRSVEELDLGTPSQETTLRPLPHTVPVVPTVTRSRSTASPRSGGRRAWRDPRVLAIVGGALLLVIGATIFATRGGSDGPGENLTDTPVSAGQEDSATPTGLAVKRSAVYDPREHAVELTITYSAEIAPLSGPFLEIIPGLGDTCPTVTWQGAQQQTNLPSATGISTPCGWSIDPGPVPARGNVAVTARLAFDPGDADPTTALQEWLDGEAAATAAAVGDPKITGSAYPVQRLQSIDIVAPSRTVSPRTLPLTLYPVWPSGRDQLEPIYRSPSVGAPSSVLTAIAGGEQGVRFSDGCSGALAVSRNGLVVTALRIAPDCQVNAHVGNFTELASNSFAIVTRGG